LGLRGASLSLGPRGASVTVGKRGVNAHVGIPGTGLSFGKRLNPPAAGGSTRSGLTEEPRSATNPAAEIDVKIKLQPDGTIALTDENGWLLDERVEALVRTGYRDRILAMLDAVAAGRGAVEQQLEVHLATPAAGPGDSAGHFPVPKPVKPGDPREFTTGTAAHDEASARWSQYMETLAHWRAAKAEHERRHGGPSASRHDVEAAVERRLAVLEWPRETIVSIETAEEGRRVLADIDLPEIEALPHSVWKVDRRGLRLIEKLLSEAVKRRAYERHVHAVLFRIAGEIFAASPAVGEVRLGGYTQRHSAATGRIEEEYVLAVRIGRAEWRTIDMSGIEAVDPVAALARFERQCARDHSGHLRPITPAF
jgi:hypothetical protein